MFLQVFDGAKRAITGAKAAIPDTTFDEAARKNEVKLDWVALITLSKLMHQLKELRTNKCVDPNVCKKLLSQQLGS